MDQRDYDAAGQAMRDFYQRSHRLVDRMMTAKGASFARAKVLKEISLGGSVRSIDLAASFGYAPRTVTEAIDGLERDGLVRREPDPDDRRAKRITLTAAGEETVKQSEATRLEYMESVFGALNVAECDEIVRLIGKLNDRLAALGG